MNWDLVVIFGSIVATVIYISSRHSRERIELIRQRDRQWEYEVIPPQKTGSYALLFGLITMAFGLACIIGSLVVQKYYDRDMMTVTLFFLFSGGAMVGYWRITADDRDYARKVHHEIHRHYLESDHKKDCQGGEAAV